MKIALISQYPLILNNLKNIIRKNFNSVFFIEYADIYQYENDPLNNKLCNYIIFANSTYDNIEDIIVFLKKHSQLSKIAVFADPCTNNFRKYLQTPISALIPKSLSVEELEDGFERFLRGERHFPIQSIYELCQNQQTEIFDDDATNVTQNLTKKQREVLLLISQGKSNKQISSELNRSLNTIQSHVGKILKHLSVSNRQQAMLFVQQHRHIFQSAKSIKNSL